MRNIFKIILLILGLKSYGQQGKLNPFRLIIVKPDTAIIDKSLHNDIDSVQLSYQKRYYNEIKEMENMLNFKSYPKEMEQQFKEIQERARKRLALAKAQEVEVKRFKYYYTLSTYSTEIYNLYFNREEPFSTIVEVPNQHADIASLKKLADEFKVDYIIYFSNVHTDTNNGMTVLNLHPHFIQPGRRKLY
ncbi:hypothetical protein [Xanthocytophaga flava]|uniref:hypothetical protein n=1 Tax=Xanthocytophaga flava TaxID=3048013 RepID=UPI0028D70B59|nr:hypothetical protein [Xanthocytophaga flavus]MDJ1469439.1 hypothetical protein [Xanthocytophaga flavus]